MENVFSIAELVPSSTGHRCGYCKSTMSSFSDGMWVHKLSIEHYQGLIDRGWRRSGEYCYKPIMTKTCCPMYTIRCAAKDFKLSRSQKKIIKRFNQFLATGVTTKSINKAKLKNTEISHMMDFEMMENVPKKSKHDLSQPDTSNICSPKKTAKKCDESDNSKVHDEASTVIESVKPTQNVPRSKSRKAKQIRIERKREKLKSRGLSEEEISKCMIAKKKMPVVKTLEEYLTPPVVEHPAHTLKIQLVKLDHDENTFEDCFVLFSKYQQAIHNESQDECDDGVFSSFLIDSPLQGEEIHGSYHQQYWLDDKLIAVGVIDILPKCISSVYFYYDPEYSFLSLGTYGALREVEFTRQLMNKDKNLQHYYMGYYIHTCPKMRYKAKLSPSYLLCPEVYTWHHIDNCVNKLDVNKYSRLNEDMKVKDEDGTTTLNDVMVLHNRCAMMFSSYSSRKKCKQNEISNVLFYSNLIGKKCCKNFLIYRQ